MFILNKSLSPILGRVVPNGKRRNSMLAMLHKMCTTFLCDCQVNRQGCLLIPSISLSQWIQFSLRTRMDSAAGNPIKKAKTQESISTSAALQLRASPFPPCWHKVLDLSYKKQVIAMYLLPSTTNFESLKVKSDSARRLILLGFILELPVSTFYSIFKGVLKEDPNLTQELTDRQDRYQVQ